MKKYGNLDKLEEKERKLNEWFDVNSSEIEYEESETQPT